MVISLASSLVFTVISLCIVCITIIGGQYSQKQDAVIVQTSFCLQIVIVVIHTMVSGNIDHQLHCKNVMVMG